MLLAAARATFNEFSGRCLCRFWGGFGVDCRVFLLVVFFVGFKSSWAVLDEFLGIA